MLRKLLNFFARLYRGVTRPHWEPNAVLVMGEYTADIRLEWVVPYTEASIFRESEWVNFECPELYFDRGEVLWDGAVLKSAFVRPLGASK